MSLLEEMDARLKAAMKAGDKAAVSALRMVRARLTERRMEKDFSGEMTDDVVQEVVSAYVKQLKKALPEYERAGEAGEETARSFAFEIEYLSAFLPRLMDEDATRVIVKETLAALAVSDPKRVGQVMGAIMKAHKGEVDPGLVRRLVEEELGVSSKEAE